VQVFPYLRMIKKYLQRDCFFENAFAEVMTEASDKQALRDTKEMCKAFLRRFMGVFQWHGPGFDVSPA
jgi:hypothetical protein